MIFYGTDNEEPFMVHVKRKVGSTAIFITYHYNALYSPLYWVDNAPYWDGAQWTPKNLLISGGHLQWRLKTVPSVRFYHELHHHLLHAGLNQREIRRIYRYMPESCLFPVFLHFRDAPLITIWDEQEKSGESIIYVHNVRFMQFWLWAHISECVICNQLPFKPINHF